MKLSGALRNSEVLEANDRPQVTRVKSRVAREAVMLVIDGVPLQCSAGDTVATALLSSRRWITDDGVRRRALFCGIGLCFECVETIDGAAGGRACMTLVRDGMRITTRRGGDQ